MKRKIVIIPLIILIIALVYYTIHDRNRSRYIVDTLECSGKGFKEYTQDILMLDFNELPYVLGATKVTDKKHYDDDHIPLFDRKGKLVYHPVFMIQQAFTLMDAYNSTKEPEYLIRAENIAGKLKDISLSINGSLFMPYSFKFALHGSKKDKLDAPWYSGMSQGEALSLFTRLYEITGKKHYLETSQKIFNSFNLSHHNKKGRPWFSCADTNKYLWLEEYPVNPPAHTLNGMIFSMFGLYDFYRVTKSPEAEKLLRGSIQTIKDNISRFRIVGDISHYCLKHPNVQRQHYHDTHAWQLEYLYKMTGDEFFLDMSNKFKSDTAQKN